MLENGGLVGNRYRILQLLGKGGMGEVYAAREFTLGRTVALKVLNPQSAGVDGALRRFSLEARTIAALSSPHIVQIYEFSPAHNPPYIAMEYVPGGDLARHIREHSAPEPRAFVEFARQLLTGLRAAHAAGIIHRDIKPANILIADGQTLKITDFGLVRSLHADEGLTNTGSTVGTVEYFPPEVAQGEKPGKYSDVYSAGITLYELLTGQLPFERDDSALKMLLRIAQEAPPPPETFRDDLPPGLRDWFARVLTFRYHERYQDAGEALAGLLEKCPDLCTGAFVVEPPAPRSDETLIFSSGFPEKAAEKSAAQEQRSRQRETPVEECTSGIDAEDGAQARSGKKKRRKDSALRAQDAQSIIGLALDLEREGRDALDEEQLVRLAAEAGVDAEAAREAIESYRTNKKKRKRLIRRAKIAALAAAAAIMLAFAIGYLLRPAEKLQRQVVVTAGGGFASSSGFHVMATDVPAAPEAASALSAPALEVGRAWTNTSLRYDSEKQVVLLRLITHPNGENGTAQSAALRARLNATADTLSPKTDRSGSRLELTNNAFQGAFFYGMLSGSGFLQLRYDGSLINAASNLELPPAPTSSGFGGDHRPDQQNAMPQGKSVPNAQAIQITQRQNELAANAANRQAISQRELPQSANAQQLVNAQNVPQSPVAQRAAGEVLPQVRVAVADKLRIAALPFAGRAEYADGTGDVVSTRLAQTNCFQVVERVQVDRVIGNLKLEQSAYFDQSTTGELGKLLGVSYLIQGAVQEAGGAYRLSAKRVDAQTGTVIESISVQGRDLFALQDQLAQDLFKAITKTELSRLTDVR